MRASTLPVLRLILLLSAGVATAEDRVEKIADSKGYRELVYHGDILAEERSFDLSGAILQESSLDASSLPVETKSYIREKGRIIRVEAADGSGATTGTMSYRYDRYGRLLGVDADGSLGPGSAGMITLHGLPQGAWVSGGEAAAKATTTVLAYDGSGRPTSLQTVVDGNPVSIEDRIYGDDGALKSVHSEDRLSGLSSDFRYDEGGRVVSRVDTPAKGPRLKTEYHYDGSGRLIEERTSGQGHPLSKSYSYDADGKVAKVETRRDGVLLLAVITIENGRQEELYEDGVMFVRATYLGGRKAKDEFFADGELARTREY